VKETRSTEEKMADYKKTKQDIINRAETDTNFCDELKTDPKGTIEKYFPQADGSTIPPKMNIVVVEDSENTVYINVVPPDTNVDAY